MAVSVTSKLQAYAQRIRNLRRANPDVPEPGLAPDFQRLIERLLPFLTVPQGLTVMPEFNNPGIGRSDIALVQGSAPPRAFIELKAPTKHADPERWTGQDRRQYERFRELSCWATCNFSEFRLLERREQTGWAQVVPPQTLRADRSDASANQAIAAHDPGPFLELVSRLCVAAGNAPSAASAPDLATALAHCARLVRGIVRDRLAELHAASPDHPLLQVRQEFRDVLYSHPEAGGYSARDVDDLFSAAFAQTLALGLLLVREGTAYPVGPNSWSQMPAEHPLMRTALRVLSQPEIVEDIGIGFSVLCDTVNSCAPEILAMQPGGRDPILY
jgi:uncharacterized protein YjeT (DUF2065 family)